MSSGHMPWVVTLGRNASWLNSVGLMFKRTLGYAPLALWSMAEGPLGLIVSGLIELVLGIVLVLLAGLIWLTMTSFLTIAGLFGFANEPKDQLAAPTQKEND